MQLVLLFHCVSLLSVHVTFSYLDIWLFITVIKNQETSIHIHHTLESHIAFKT